MSSSSAAASRPSFFRQHWELFLQFTLRAVATRHRGSHLGVFWTVITPLLSLGLYTVVFGWIFGGEFKVLPTETGVDYALAVFLGLILFHITAETLGSATSLIVNNPNLVKKVVFPVAILPLAQVASLWINFLISLALLLVGILVTGRSLTLTGMLWLPAILLPHILFTAGLALAFAALGVFFRDLAQIIPFASQVILYASAVFYPLTRIPETVWLFLKWNPLLHTVFLARDALLWHRPISIGNWSYTLVCGVLVFSIGAWIFNKTRDGFADVI